jgi:uncharacterized membrane protein
MNLAHLHLLLNHFPTVGFGVGLGILLVALAAKSDRLKQVGLEIVFLIALLTIVVYLSGNAADLAIGTLPGVSESLISVHENAALVAYVFMELTGFAAFLGLWQLRRTARTASWNLPAVLLLSIVTFALMARAANLGGEIRHSEIRSGFNTAAAENQTTPTEEKQTATAGDEEPATAEPEEKDDGSTVGSISAFVNDNLWVWPTCETLHFIGMCILMGVVLLVNTRMLGMIKNVSFAAIHRLLPLGLLGFGINLLTGVLFFIGSPGRYINNVGFQWKMVLLLLAGANTLYFISSREVWSVGSEDDAPLKAKVISVFTMLLWIGVMYFGRMLPFFGKGGG